MKNQARWRDPAMSQEEHMDEWCALCCMWWHAGAHFNACICRCHLDENAQDPLGTDV